MKNVKNLRKWFEQLDKKTKQYLLIISVITIFFCVVSASGVQNDQELKHDELKLPEYGQDNVVIPVDVKIEKSDGSVNMFSTLIELEPREYSDEEAEIILKEASERVEELILGANSSLEEVHSNLELVTSIEGLPVDISWYSTNYELVDSSGRVNNETFEQGQTCNVILFALISCKEHSKELAIPVRVINRDMTDQDVMIASIQKEINAAVFNSSDGYVELPKEYEGGKLSYYKVQEEQQYIWIMLGVVAMVAVIAGDSKQKKLKMLERRKQLVFDYSEVISKITLLMGAGMTIQRAWERIVMDYKGQVVQAGKRYVYEEMVESYNQIKAGVPEAEVYEQFGSRCNVKEYQKFSALIVQNLKKGTKDLAALLELEAIEAFEKRKNLAKVKGEEAGTKLLVPMIIMLVVVMIMIMVPAMMTFEM